MRLELVESIKEAVIAKDALWRARKEAKTSKRPLEACIKDWTRKGQSAINFSAHFLHRIQQRFEDSQYEEITGAISRLIRQPKNEIFGAFTKNEAESYRAKKYIDEQTGFEAIIDKTGSVNGCYFETIYIRGEFSKECL